MDAVGVVGDCQAVGWCLAGGADHEVQHHGGEVGVGPAQVECLVDAGGVHGLVEGSYEVRGGELGGDGDDAAAGHLKVELGEQVPDVAEFGDGFQVAGGDLVGAD